MDRGPSGAIWLAPQWSDEERRVQRAPRGIERVADQRSVTSVTASLGHSAANAGDVSWFGCGVGRAVSYRVGDRYYCTIDNVDPGARYRSCSSNDRRRGRTQ